MRLTRRELALTLGASVGFVAAARRSLDAQAQAPAAAPAAVRTTPPSVVSTPPRDFTPGAAPVTYPDPDVIVIDPAFNGLRLFNAPIQRLWTGGLWMEGPAWNGQGRYLVWSDIPNDRQMRYVASACSARRRITATATRSISRAASCPASTRAAASSATSMRARSR